MAMETEHQSTILRFIPEILVLVIYVQGARFEDGTADQFM